MMIICSKYCIQSETRFDFLKDLVTTVPELQGDMDYDGGLGVMGEMRVPGLGRARGEVARSWPGHRNRRTNESSRRDCGHLRRTDPRMQRTSRDETDGLGQALATTAHRESNQAL